MDIKESTGVFPADELASILKQHNVELPEEIEIPFTVKLSPQFALHIDKRGFGLRGGEYVQLYSYRVTQNNVVFVKGGL